jgi:hypothetical protein
VQPGSGFLVLPCVGSQVQLYDVVRDCHVARIQVTRRNTSAASDSLRTLPLRGRSASPVTPRPLSPEIWSTAMCCASRAQLAALHSPRCRLSHSPARLHMPKRSAPASRVAAQRACMAHMRQMQRSLLHLEWLCAARVAAHACGRCVPALKRALCAAAGGAYREAAVVLSAFTHDAATLVTVESLPTTSPGGGRRWHALKFWDVHNSGSAHTVYSVNSVVNDAHFGEVSALACHPRDVMVATACVGAPGRSGEVRLWRQHHFKRTPGTAPGAPTWHWRCVRTLAYQGACSRALMCARRLCALCHALLMRTHAHHAHACVRLASASSRTHLPPAGAWFWQPHRSAAPCRQSPRFPAGCSLPPCVSHARATLNPQQPAVQALPCTAWPSAKTAARSRPVACPAWRSGTAARGSTRRRW